MDYSQYHPDWKDIIRPSILRRDQYKCKVCGIKHKSRVYRNTNSGYVECDEFMEEWARNNGRKVFTLYLQIAHLNHDKSNNEPSNLQALCPIHHARHDKEHKKFQRLLFKAKISDNVGKTKRQVLPLRKQYIEQIQNLVRVFTKTKIDIQQAESILNECLRYVESIK
jgi:hypothetical protein